MLIPSIQPVDAPQAYWDRQAAIAGQATGVGGVPHLIRYTPDEHAMWARSQELLAPVWERFAAEQMHHARQALDLPSGEIPQLALVSERLSALTGFEYASVRGTVPGHDFFAALAQRIFPSTQFIRWSGSPGYTPEPDVLHEVGGHAVSLAHPQLAELHRLAGLASLVAPSMLTSIASVFWYSIEFGVVASPSGWKAYGAGLLSSPGELGWFVDHAQVRPLDVAAMASIPYDINRFQPLLFGADSLDHVFEVVGGFYIDIIRSIRSGDRDVPPGARHQIESLESLDSQERS